MGGSLSSFAVQALAFVAFAVLALVVPYARRKRGYWTGRGVPVAQGRRALAATLPGVRMDEGSLSRYRDEGLAAGAAVLGMHDAGRPCALACDVRVASAASSNDGFVGEQDDRREGPATKSVIPSVVDATGSLAVLPAMSECVIELITSLEGVANRGLNIVPFAEVKKCAARAVATCVYGQPMIDSRLVAFAEQCDKALTSAGRSGARRRQPTLTDYFAGYDVATDDRKSSVDFKRLLRAAVADNDEISSDVADEQVRRHMFEFVTGAIEPTAALVTAVLYELSRDQNLQNRLREHVDGELGEHQQQVTIDQLDRLTYLENVLRETLRKYPLVTVIRRLTTKPYTVTNGSNHVTLEPGTLVAVPVHAIHHDVRHFDEPEKFQPNRFPAQLTSAYMPHGTGPQSYIGKHFVGLEAKLIVAMLVSRYEVHVDSSQPCRTPDPFNIMSYANISLKVTNRKGAREATLGKSLREFNIVNGDKKFLIF